MKGRLTYILFTTEKQFFYNAPRTHYARVWVAVAVAFIYLKFF